MSFLQKLFSGGAGALVDSVGKVIDQVTTTKEEKMQLELELKKAEQEFQLEMRKLSVQEQQQVYQDVASARAMTSAVQTSANATKLSKNVSPYLALGTALLTFVLFYALVFHKDYLTKNDSKDIVLYILGVLSAILTQIYSFYFGSSQGSADKAKFIEDIQKQKNVP